MEGTTKRRGGRTGLTTPGVRRGTRRAILVGLVAVLVGLVAAGTVVAPLPAAAAPVGVSLLPVAGWSTNGPVYATAIVGDTVYAGGSFTQVRNQSGTQTLARTNLAAFDRVTGAIRTGFTADTNGVIRALESDGTRLYVGGSFTSIRGVARSRLAAIDPATGAVATTFVANASSHVYALARRGTRLYVGGAFGTIGGATRGRLAAVSTTTGAVDPTFLPNADNSIRAVVASPDGTTVYAGGQFTSIGGATRSWLGAVSATTGASTGLAFDHAPDNQVIALDVSPTGDRLFVGSMANRAAAYDTRTGGRRWFQQADGDVQAIRYHAGNVYFGFHESFAGDTSVRLLAADAATGALEPWRPGIDSFFGVWAIAAGPDGLAVGGEFTTFSGVRTQGLAVLGRASTDAVAPTPPSALAVTATTSSTVTLAWAPGADETGVAGYRIRRDGADVGYTTGTVFTEADLAPATGYDYTVQTLDLAGNTSTATGIRATTAAALVTTRSTWRYSDLGTNLGTAWRAPGYADAGWASGPGELGYGDGDEATVVSGGPDPNNRYVTTYFRRHFTVADPAAITAATLRLLRDDGAVAYLNGTEIARSNLPAGTIGFTTRASTGTPDETTYFPFAVAPARFVAGDNVLAVEVHQNTVTSGDVSFDAALDVTLGAPGDTTPPTVPAGLAAPTVAWNRVGLAWTPATDAVGVTAYDVRRDGVVVGTTATATFTDTTVAASSTYAYSVVARDAAGNASAPGVPLSVTTPAASADTTPPSVPGNLRITARSATTVALAWNAATDNTAVAAYVVNRDGVDLPATGAVSLTDAGLAAGSGHTYTVRAVDASGNQSPPSGGVTTTTHAATETAFPAGSVWRFTEDGIDRGTAWRAAAYDDSTWRSGAGQLGYGDGDETTVMDNGGAVVANRFISHYLRRSFDVSDASTVGGVTLSVLRDDGVVVYVNGVEAFRDNMPAGTVTAGTYASTGLFDAAENAYVDFTVPRSLLVEGRNVIAVSVHNNSRSGAGDLGFDARLTLRY